MSEIVTYKFDTNGFENIKKMKYGYDWPVVYIINNDNEAYIGQTTGVYNRTKQHYNNLERKQLKKISIIYDDQFNISAILDIESMLIKNIGADGKFKLQNLALGCKEHSYYQRLLYQDKFAGIWKLLIKNKLVVNELKTIKNSDLFKFSPYKTLTDDQYNTSYEIFDSLLEHLEQKEKASFIVNGGAGTGKTVLAVFLFKMIRDFYDNKYNMDDLGEEYTFLMHKLLLLRENKEFEIGLVIPMTSLRQTLKTVFSKIKGLKSSMVIGPSDVLKKHYNLLIVDEAHRLKRRVNLTNYDSFDKNNKTLNLGEEGSELDWIKKCSEYQIFFYDKTQSVKPTDVRRSDFEILEKSRFVDFYTLTSQLRVEGGNDYIDFINSIFNPSTKKSKTFDNYDFKIFDKVDEMVNAIKMKDLEFGLCRNVAGYAWKWNTKKLSRAQIDAQKEYDIEIDNHKYIWNTVGSDWVNSPNAINEIGCIHTIQGYDLNYAGVILGNEIKFDKKSSKMIIDSSQYFDANGSRSIKNEEELYEYIINIYKVLLTRGIKGTYVYVCDDNLREYFKKFSNDNK